MAKKSTPTRRVDPENQPEIVRRFAANLRRLRHERGLTQAELSRRAKIALSYVGRLEAGTSAPGIDLLDRLAGALGVSPADLLPTDDDRRDEVAALRQRAGELSATLVETAGADTLRMLNPLLARLIEGERRGG
ncbi:helix-turn-helix domain-containing protein [Alienimonas sp. DA493]|uniref:helix-turn-helix domain-containing protein n=1 Tax=Alienimonas sp. DA493 TaxID=3373605 RepID=UPI0037547399